MWIDVLASVLTVVIVFMCIRRVYRYGRQAEARRWKQACSVLEYQEQRKVIESYRKLEYIERGPRIMVPEQQVRR
jgi:hypothetical protein